MSGRIYWRLAMLKAKLGPCFLILQAVYDVYVDMYVPSYGSKMIQVFPEKVFNPSNHTLHTSSESTYLII